MKPHEIFYNKQHIASLLRCFVSAGTQLHEKTQTPPEDGVLIIRTTYGLFMFNGNEFEMLNMPEYKIPYGDEFYRLKGEIEAELKIIDHVNETLDRAIDRPHRY